MTIKTTFTKWNDTWTLLKRTNDWAMFKREGKNGVHFEVCRISRYKYDVKWPNTDKVTKKGTEYLRLNEANDYGINAWCYMCLEDAEHKFNLVKTNK